MSKRVKSKISSGNFFEKNCRGQFYLVAGMIIISIIIGLVAIANYIEKSQTMIVNDLKEELKIETQKVIEYGAAQMNQYGIDYSSHLGSDIELYFIMGVDPNIEVKKYVNGDVDLNVPGLTIDNINDKIIFTLDEVDHEFDLMPTENFYYLISQEIKGERFVATG